MILSKPTWRITLAADLLVASAEDEALPADGRYDNPGGFAFNLLQDLGFIDIFGDYFFVQKQVDTQQGFFLI